MIQARVKIIDTAKRNTRIVWLYLGAFNIHARVVSFFFLFSPFFFSFTRMYSVRVCACGGWGGIVGGVGGRALGGGGGSVDNDETAICTSLSKEVCD